MNIIKKIVLVIVFLTAVGFIWCGMCLIRFIAWAE